MHSDHRRRFRKGRSWIREPLDAYGDKSVQTTKAIELNYSILRAVLLWMPTPKLSIKQVEPEACIEEIYKFHFDHNIYIYIYIHTSFPSLKPPDQVKALFRKMSHVPDDRKQAWIDAWSIRNLVSFSLKRARDAERREQKPRVSLLILQYKYLKC